MKYDSQIAQLKSILPTAKNILITLPTGANIDKLAAGLSLFLNFEASGKQVSIVCDDNILVGQSHLFGVDHIQKNLPNTEGGNLTLTLEGVAAADNSVPSLEKLDWYAENNNLNLVFHVLPNQTFQPARIIPHYQGSGFDLIFVIGAANLNALGNVYSQNTNAFSGPHIVNIDNQTTNTSYGQTNVVDIQASSISEIMANVISDLGLNLDADSATNLLTGIFDATNNLMDPKANADTYMAVASCVRAGGKKPGITVVSPINPQQDLSQLMPKREEPQAQAIPDYMVPPVIPSTSQPEPVSQEEAPVEQSAPIASTNQPSPEERPSGEGVISETVEPDWLTPKIFKGSSIG